MKQLFDFVVEQFETKSPGEDFETWYSNLNDREKYEILTDYLSSLTVHQEAKLFDSIICYE